MPPAASTKFSKKAGLLDVAKTTRNRGPAKVHRDDIAKHDFFTYSMEPILAVLISDVQCTADIMPN
jgi:hypothetical protein